MTENKNRVVILNNIRSNENVGSIFRTCDAAGISRIILVGYTPAPLDRFGRENKGLAKAALSAEKFVEWEKVETLKEAIEKLNNSPQPSLKLREGAEQSKFKIVGIEQAENSIHYREIKTSKLLAPSSQLALVFGNEVDGLSPEDKKLCDAIAEIPMLGQKESLNVAVSVGIVLYSFI